MSALPTVDGIAPGSTWLAYLRDSGGDKQSASCDQQHRMVADVLAAAGASLARPPYRDEARSGSSTVGRHALDRLLSEAQPGTADGVIFWSSARMAREVNDAQIIRATLRKRGYRVVFIADQVPQIGIWTPLLEVVQDIRNAQYLDTLSKEIKRAHGGLLRLGYVPMGKPAPPGYRVEREQYGTHRDGAPMLGIRWVKDPDTAKQVALAWKLRLAGHSLKAVYRATQFYAQSTNFGRFFKNAIYKGVFVWGGQDYPGFCEPYVTAEEWDQAQAIGQARNSFHPRELANHHLLIGLLYCPVCGHRMNIHHINRANRHGKRYHHLYYVCNQKRNDWRACPQPLVRADHLEERVVEKVQAVYFDAAELARVYAAWQAAPENAGADAERGRLQVELEQGERETANLLQLAKLGQFAAVAAELAALEAAQAERRARLAELAAAVRRVALPPLSDVRAQAEELRAALSAGDAETAHLVMLKLVARIDLKAGNAPHVILRRPGAT